MKIFPYDSMSEKDFIDLLCELEEVGCIKGYVVDGERYINIPNFATYQTVRKPSGTNIPDPPKRTEKAKTTKVLREWRNGDVPVQSYDDSDVPVTQCVGTGNTEVMNERSNFSLREKIAKEKDASGDAALADATPPAAPECANCLVPMERTSSHKPNGSVLYRCPLCAEEVWT